jgi:hypothetical protein
MSVETHRTPMSVETHSTSVDLGSGLDSVVRDGVEVSDLKERQAIIDEIDQLAHQFLTTGAGAAGLGGGLTVTSSTSVVVDGRPVSPDDPSAREKMLEAISKLRAQGLDDVADDIARQLGVAPQAPPSASRRTEATKLVEPAAKMCETSAAEMGEASAGAEPAGDDAPEEARGPTPPTPPDAPTPPEPPSPP